MNQGVAKATEKELEALACFVLFIYFFDLWSMPQNSPLPPFHLSVTSLTDISRSYAAWCERKTTESAEDILLYHPGTAGGLHGAADGPDPELRRGPCGPRHPLGHHCARHLGREGEAVHEGSGKRGQSVGDRRPRGGEYQAIVALTLTKFESKCRT